MKIFKEGDFLVIYLYLLPASVQWVKGDHLVWLGTFHYLPFLKQQYISKSIFLFLCPSCTLCYYILQIFSFRICFPNSCYFLLSHSKSSIRIHCCVNRIRGVVRLLVVWEHHKYVDHSAVNPQMCNNGYTNYCQKAIIWWIYFWGALTPYGR